MNVDELILSLVKRCLLLITKGFLYRNRRYLKAQKKKHNQQQLCKVSYDRFFSLLLQLSFLDQNFAHVKKQHCARTEILEKLSKKEEQCTLVAAESESLRSQLAGEKLKPFLLYFSVRIF